MARRTLVDRLFGKQIQKAAAEGAAQIVRRNALKMRAMYGFWGSGFSRSGGAKWNGGLSSPYGGYVLDHWTLRQQARDAYQDNSVARSIVDRYADTVADTGLKLSPSPSARVLGRDPQELAAWAEDVGERFDLWAKSKKQHRSRTMTWYQSHRLYEIYQQRDNDVIGRLYYSPGNDLLSPLQWEMLDPNQLRGDAWTSMVSQVRYPDGIERNPDGSEKAFKFWIQRPGETAYNDVTIPKEGPKSHRTFILHGFAPEYAGQGRGYSRLAHALQEFENLTDFTSAQIKKAIAQSMMVLGTETDSDDPASNPFEQYGTPPAGPAAMQFGSVPTPDAQAVNVTTESLAPVNYTQIEEATLKVPGSVGVFNLQGREHLKMYQNTAPVTDYDKFVDAFTAYLCAASGMPIEVLLIRFSQNYSASRATLILFWRIAEIWRQEMAADYLNPTYEMWLACEIAAGRVSAPGWSDPRLRQAWLTCRWIGVPRPDIDPLRSAKANQINAELGATTLDDIALANNGSSGKANRAKLAREFAELPPAPWNETGKAPPGGDDSTPGENNSTGG